MKKIPIFLSAVATALCLVSSSAVASEAKDIIPEDQRHVLGEPVADGLVDIYRERAAYYCNLERKKADLPELLYSPSFAEPAQIRSKEISYYYWSKDRKHYRPDGRESLTVLDDFEIIFKNASENMGRGPNTPESIVKNWMNSNDHREAILNSDYTYIGIGATDAYGYISWSGLLASTYSTYSDGYLPRNFGDVNQDDIVDARDASKVLKEYAGTSVGEPPEFNETQQILADMNSDNIVDANDASIILNMYKIGSVSN